MRVGKRESAVLAWLVAAMCAGCGMFNTRRSADLAYERIRDEVNGPGAGNGSDVQQASFQEQEQDDDGISLSDFSADNAGRTLRRITGRGPKPELARELYVQAEAEFREASQSQGDRREDLFESAAKKYEKAAKRWPDSALEQDAMFMVGECYFFADKYPESNEAYEKLLKKYPNSRHLDTVESRSFKIAKYWLDLHQTKPVTFNLSDDSRPWRATFGSAVKVYDRIRMDDPTGKLADDATMAAATAHFAKGDYVRADDFFTDLRKTFPSSEHQFSAHLLGLKAKMETYRGPNYDGDALDEAEKLIKQMRRQFPREAQAESEYLARAYAEVRYKKAEREWKMARYYDRRREYGGARFYYSAIVNDFADTPFAERARQRLVEIRDKPASPQRLKWLVDLFPGNETVQPLIASGQ